MDLQQYEAIRALVLGLVESAPDGVLVKDIVAAAHDIYGGGHPLFPKGRLTNYCTFTKVDLEARCEIERVPGKSPQRIKRWDK